MREYDWDKRLKINTTGRDDFHADNYHYPYEPTPYSVLELLAESGYIEENHTVVDYGCGKGRVGFFLSHVIGCDVIGVEFDADIYGQARTNLKSYNGKKKPEFVCGRAEEYNVSNEDCFYFFNPFSVEILQSVLGGIIESYYENPREIKMFFYYPEDEYVSYLMTKDELMFLDEIDCQELFSGGNQRERILIFEIA